MNQRIFRFRAWDKKKKEMYWNLFLENFALLLDEPYGYKDVKYEDLEIMQYTGLKDKHGREIYEGDIIQDQDRYKGIVKFGDGTFDCGIYKFTGFYIESLLGTQFEDDWELTGNAWDLKGYRMTYTEIIGNIYESPELLKGNNEEITR